MKRQTLIFFKSSLLAVIAFVSYGIWIGQNLNLQQQNAQKIDTSIKQKIYTSWLTQNEKVQKEKYMNKLKRKYSSTEIKERR